MTSDSQLKPAMCTSVSFFALSVATSRSTYGFRREDTEKRYTRPALMDPGTHFVTSVAEVSSTAYRRGGHIHAETIQPR